MHTCIHVYMCMLKNVIMHVSYLMYTCGLCSTTTTANTSSEVARGWMSWLLMLVCPGSLHLSGRNKKPNRTRRTEPAEPNRTEPFNFGSGRNRTQNRTEPDRATTRPKSAGRTASNRIFRTEPNRTEYLFEKSRTETNRTEPVPSWSMHLSSAHMVVPCTRDPKVLETRLFAPLLCSADTGHRDKCMIQWRPSGEFVVRHSTDYGKFSNFQICFCGLDPGNLKSETVRTHERHVCF